MIAKCNYNRCENDATAKGFVITKHNKSTKLYACDVHKKANSFFVTEDLHNAATAEK